MGDLHRESSTREADKNAEKLRIKGSLGLISVSSYGYCICIEFAVVISNAILNACRNRSKIREILPWREGSRTEWTLASTPVQIAHLSHLEESALESIPSL